MLTSLATVDYPGIDVIDASTPTISVTPYGVCLMLLSAFQGPRKQLIRIRSLAEFTATFGTNSTSQKYVRSFFANRRNAAVDLQVYRVNVNQGDPPSDPLGIANSSSYSSPWSRGFSPGFGTGTAAGNVTALPAVLNDWLEAINTIDPSFSPGGIIVAPEAFETLTLNDCSLVVTAFNKFCDLDNDSYWQGIVDLPPYNNGLSEAVTDRNAYNSVNGSVCLYEPFYFNDLDQRMCPSAAIAAMTLDLWSTGQFQRAPAGLEFSIKDCNRLGYSVSQSELALAHTSRINMIRFFANYGFVPYDCQTLTIADEYRQIVSVVCFKIVSYLLKTQMVGLVFSSHANSEAESVTLAEAKIHQIMFGAWQAGYLDGENANDAYELRRLADQKPTPGKALLSYELAFRPAFAILKYRLFLRNLERV